MSETARRVNNFDKALTLLRARGQAGVTNAELLEAAGFRYGARLLEIRRAGWHVESRHEHDGQWRFILHGPANPGQQVLFQEIA
jgi:hypothetical protein